MRRRLLASHSLRLRAFAFPSFLSESVWTLKSIPSSWIRPSESICNAMNSVFYKPFAKVDDKSEFEIGQAQVCERLRFEDFVVFARRFALDNDQIAYDQIDF